MSREVFRFEGLVWKKMRRYYELLMAWKQYQEGFIQCACLPKIVAFTPAYRHLGCLWHVKFICFSFHQILEGFSYFHSMQLVTKWKWRVFQFLVTKSQLAVCNLKKTNEEGLWITSFVGRRQWMLWWNGRQHPFSSCLASCTMVLKAW